MTKAQIELLMTRDVDEISEVAVHLPSKQLRVTLKNAAALLAREEQPAEVDERLFIFKLLRFVQAALAGAREPVNAEVAREVFRSAQMVMKINIAPDVNRSARDMLSVLLTEKTQRELLRNQFVSMADIAAVYQLRSDEPLRHLVRNPLKALKAKVAPHGATSKPQSVRTRGSSKPKGLLR
jgi:hypothetical protein